MVIGRANRTIRIHLRRIIKRTQGLAIDFAARAVFISDQRVTLTPKEYRLLQILAQHPGNVVTHQHLLREVWGNEHIDDTHYLRIFVRKLRRKIEADPTSQIGTGGNHKYEKELE